MPPRTEHKYPHFVTSDWVLPIKSRSDIYVECNAVFKKQLIELLSTRCSKRGDSQCSQSAKLLYTQRCGYFVNTYYPDNVHHNHCYENLLHQLVTRSKQHLSLPYDHSLSNSNKTNSVDADTDTDTDSSKNDIIIPEYPIIKNKFVWYVFIRIPKTGSSTFMTSLAQASLSDECNGHRFHAMSRDEKVLSEHDLGLIKKVHGKNTRDSKHMSKIISECNLENSRSIIMKAPHADMVDWNEAFNKAKLKGKHEVAYFTMLRHPRNRIISEYLWNMKRQVNNCQGKTLI